MASYLGFTPAKRLSSLRARPSAHQHNGQMHCQVASSRYGMRCGCPRPPGWACPLYALSCAPSLSWQTSIKPTASSTNLSWDCLTLTSYLCLHVLDFAPIHLEDAKAEELLSEEKKSKRRKKRRQAYFVARNPVLHAFELRPFHREVAKAANYITPLLDYLTPGIASCQRGGLCGVQSEDFSSQGFSREFEDGCSQIAPDRYEPPNDTDLCPYEAWRTENEGLRLPDTFIPGARTWL